MKINPSLGLGRGGARVNRRPADRCAGSRARIGPESNEWDPVPGHAGHKAFEAASEDEDDEGRTDAAQLFEEGLEEAEYERMLEAAQPQGKSRRRKHR
jgi:hypothetical protein